MEASGYSAFAYLNGLPKKKKSNVHRVMVSCSLVGARVVLLYELAHQVCIEVLGSLGYCRVERNGTPDVSAASSRRDHRKSKFGLRHAIKLIELYGVTKSEF